MNKVDEIRIEHRLEFRLRGVLKPSLFNSHVIVHFPADALPDQFRSFLRFSLVVGERPASSVRRALPEKFVLRVVA